MQKIFLGILVLIVFSGCIGLDEQKILLTYDENYFLDLNVSDANFLNLNDTPNSYVGEANKCVAVKGTEDGLEFIVCGTGSFTDTNFMTFNDFNKLYVSWLDGNQTYWKQIDLNSLLQLSDFNNMIINLGEAQGWNASAIDSNWQTSFYLLDQNLSVVYARILDVNGADNLRLLLEDLNNFGGINYSAIADINAIIIQLAESLNWNLDTNCSMQGSCPLIAYVTDVNASLNLKANITDVNGANNLIRTDMNFWFWKQTDLNTRLQITDFNKVWLSKIDGNLWYAKKTDINTTYARITDVNAADALRAKITDVNSADILRALITDVNGADALNVLRSDWTTINNYPAACSAGQYVSAIGDTLTCSTPAGGTGTDTNIFTAGLMKADTNSWNIDVNGGGNDLFNFKDLNATRLFIRVGDLNFTINDKNIIMETSNGRIVWQPDYNRTVYGQANAIQAYQQLTCSGSDCNFTMGFI